MRRLVVCWLLLAFAPALSLAADLSGTWVNRDFGEKYYFEESDSAVTGYWIMRNGTRCSLSGETTGDRVISQPRVESAKERSTAGFMIEPSCSWISRGVKILSV